MPYLIKKQFSAHKHSHQENEHDNSANFTANVKTRPKLFDYIKTDKLEQLISKTSIKNRPHDPFNCYAFVQADGFCFRANNLTVFAEANRQIPKLMQHFQRERVDSVGRFDKNQVRHF